MTREEIIEQNEDTMLDIAYKLSSGSILLVDQYNYIVGVKANEDRKDIM